MSIDYSNFKFPKGGLKKIIRKKDVTLANKLKIKEMFHYQCALCKRKGTQIHHIIYRSEDQSKIDDIDNLILLCTECHNTVHESKKHWQPILKKIRKTFK